MGGGERGQLQEEQGKPGGADVVEDGALKKPVKKLTCEHKIKIAATSVGEALSAMDSREPFGLLGMFCNLTWMVVRQDSTEGTFLNYTCVVHVTASLLYLIFYKAGIKNLWC